MKTLTLLIFSLFIYKASHSQNTIPATTLSGIGPADAQEIVRGTFNFNASASPLSTISITSGSRWKAIFRGMWANNYEGGNLPQPAAYIELTSGSPSIGIGIITLTISRDGSTGKLVAITTSNVPEKSIGFTGTIDIISNNITAASQHSLILPGNVGIGTTKPTEKLEVNGIIRSKEVKVEVSPWPDYVFDSSYSLPALNDTEEFIKKSKHLPGIPSAEKSLKTGSSLGR